MTKEVEIAWLDEGDRIGEGPYWHGPSQTLYWVDILDQELHSLDRSSGTHRTTRLAEKVHAIAVARFPWAVCTVHKHGLAWLNLANGALSSITHPEPDEGRFLLNDGRCDSSGTFWFGAISKKDLPDSGFFRVDATLEVQRMFTGLNASNGVAFSPNGRHVYVADTHRGILAFDIGASTLSTPRLLLENDDKIGLPDGMTIDTDGCLWVAMVHGGRVIRLTPTGQIDRTIQMPCDNVMSCTFGGSDLRTLFVTSGKAGMNDEALRRSPLAGATFAVSVASQGLAEVPFAGVPPLIADGSDPGKQP